jgi:hypothetical protein
LNEITQEDQGISFVEINNKDEYCKIHPSECTIIKIREIRDGLIDINLNNYDDFKLLQMNCEGCEYDVLENLIKYNLIKNYEVIQFAMHAVNDNLSRRYLMYFC